MTKEKGEWEYNKTKPSEKAEQESEEEFEEVVPDLQNIWLPTEKGDSLVGEAVEISEGQYGIYAIIKMEDGETIQTPAHKILQSRIDKIEVGDFIRIVYEGVTKTQSGRKVNDYRLLKKKARAE